MEIRGKSISYSAYRKKPFILREQTLIQGISNIEAENIGVINILEEKKSELENIRREKYKEL